MHPYGQPVTGEAVALDLRLANAGSRGVAAAIDLAIEYVLLSAGFVAVGVVAVGANVAVTAIVALLVFVGVLLGYPVLFETLWHGRTPGKAIMGLRVVRDDGGPIRFRHALVRGLTGVFLEKLGITVGLAAFILIVVGAHKKRIGDHFCGTVVLQERVPGSLEAPIFMPPVLAGWAAGLDLTGIDDALALRIRQFLGRAGALTPTARTALENQLAIEVVGRVGPPPAGTPSWAVLTAVLAERRTRALRAQAPPPAWPPPGAPSATYLPQPPQPEQPATPPAPASTTGYIPPG